MSMIIIINFFFNHAIFFHTNKISPFLPFLLFITFPFDARIGGGSEVVDGASDDALFVASSFSFSYILFIIFYINSVGE